MDVFTYQPQPYNSEWPQWYKKAESEILKAFDSRLLGLRLYHIGSTSIPQMMAKPIIDILGEVKNRHEIENRASALTALSYEFKGEFGIADRVYFSREKSDSIPVHLHFFSQGHWQIKKHLLFRDFLIHSPSAAEAYRQKKVDLLLEFPNNREAYQNGKKVIIDDLMERAKAWAGLS